MEKEISPSHNVRDCSIPFGDLNLETIFQGSCTSKTVRK
jgi:hypothetical protein